jgi:mannitol operon transcriptional antiterminator
MYMVTNAAVAYKSRDSLQEKIPGLACDLSPRLSRVLDTLISAEEPVKVDTLAEMLCTSRRTVFRELENAERILSDFAAEIVSVPGRGIILNGEESAKQALAEALAEHIPSPGNRRERPLRLLTELLSNSGNIQKLFYYADELGVSESTISNDLDELELWLSEHGVTLLRKSGLGVLLEGTEAAIRLALVNRFIMDGQTMGRSYSAVFKYPGENIEQGVREVLRRLWDKLDWMSAESHEMIALYLMVMLERLGRGRTIQGEDAALPAGEFQTHLAAVLAEELAVYFQIALSLPELRELTAQIAACRAKQDNPIEAGNPEKAELIESLSYEMIEAFDPPVAAILKTNEQLVRMLRQHLGPTLTRLEKKLELPDPLDGSLAQQYPEVYQKTRRAAGVLETRLGKRIPESEISFIAVHFLAALSVLGEKNIRRRVLRAGIICVAGIGMSHLLASQIRKRFKGELEIDISGWDDRPSWEKADFLISTIPLENTAIPLILIHSLLEEEDFLNIQNTINAHAFEQKDAAPSGKGLSLKNRVESAIQILEQTMALLANFSIKRIAPACSFEELADYAGKQFAGEEEAAGKIKQALLEREAVGSQVFPDLGIVLLHARTGAVSVPVFALILPEGGSFLDDHFQNAQSCVLLLLPQECPPEMTAVMGSISSNLIDTPAFLDAVRTGNRKLIISILETDFSEVLSGYCGEKLKE